MKSVWKWIIGLVVFLLIIASIVCSHAYIRNRTVGFMGMDDSFHSFGYMPHMDGKFPGYDEHKCASNPHMDGKFGGYDGHPYGNMPHMDGKFPGYDGYRSNMPFKYMTSAPRISYGYSLMRGLLPLTLLGLLVYGAYHLGTKRSGSSVEKSEHVESDENESVLESSDRTCVKCGEVLQEEWRNCPHCGKRQ